MPSKTYLGVAYNAEHPVYVPAEDTFLLLREANCHGKVLEIGTGSGLIAIYLAKQGLQVDAVDISKHALECASANCVANGVSIRLVQSDLFHDVRGKYDTIIFNPPYLPVNDQIEGAEAWNGGSDGFYVIRRFLEGAPDHLSESGVIFMILSDLTDINSLINEFSNFIFTRLGSEHFESETIYAYQLKLGR
ncbi:MAG: methyltransferase [Candidatus Thermoplasmatota archaeon]|nr:methyltransferase [Candidatus Thermoplasmatota archaeon]